MTSQWTLVTGAAGFIGSQLVDRLLAEGRSVIGLDNLSLGKTAHLASALKNPQFKFFEADLLDLDRGQLGPLEPFKGKVERVWHLAANSDISAGVADARIDLKDTFLSTFNAIRILPELGAKQVAFASTSAVYGNREELLTESSGPLFPISNYGAMKLASEAALSAALESQLERVWIFRFPNVVGPRATHGALYDFVKKLRFNPKELAVLGDGSQAKPYLHVSELLDAMLFIVAKAPEKLAFYNIGVEGESTPVRWIAETAVSVASPGAKILYGKSDRGWVGDVPRFTYSVEKLRKLGWSPKLNSNESVRRALQEIAAEHPPV